jgi:hypothetical protein
MEFLNADGRDCSEKSADGRDEMTSQSLKMGA